MPTRALTGSALSVRFACHCLECHSSHASWNNSLNDKSLNVLNYKGRSNFFRFVLPTLLLGGFTLWMQIFAVWIVHKITAKMQDDAEESIETGEWDCDEYDSNLTWLVVMCWSANCYRCRPLLWQCCAVPRTCARGTAHTCAWTIPTQKDLGGTQGV